MLVLILLLGCSCVLIPNNPETPGEVTQWFNIPATLNKPWTLFKITKDNADLVMFGYVEFIRDMLNYQMYYSIQGTRIGIGIKTAQVSATGGTYRISYINVQTSVNTQLGEFTWAPTTSTHRSYKAFSIATSGDQYICGNINTPTRWAMRKNHMTKVLYAMSNRIDKSVINIYDSFYCETINTAGTSKIRTNGADAIMTHQSDFLRQYETIIQMNNTQVDYLPFPECNWYYDAHYLVPSTTLFLILYKDDKFVKYVQFAKQGPYRRIKSYNIFVTWSMNLGLRMYFMGTIANSIGRYKIAARLMDTRRITIASFEFTSRYQSQEGLTTIQKVNMAGVEYYKCGQDATNQYTQFYQKQTNEEYFIYNTRIPFLKTSALYSNYEWIHCKRSDQCAYSKKLTKA